MNTRPSKLATGLRIFAKVWCYAVVVVVLFGYAMLAYTQGFRELLRIASPFNIWNDIAVVITLLPAVFAWMGADKIERRPPKT